MHFEDLKLVGLDTKEVLTLGTGLRHWNPMQFCGPVLRALQLQGAPDRRLLVLPQQLLQRLYARFGQSNPSGTPIADSNEIESILFDMTMSQDERTELYDSGEIGWDIFDPSGPDKGRGRFLRYLPELEDPSQQQAILTDETLELTITPVSAPDSFEEWWRNASCHYRWSSWWNDRSLEAGPLIQLPQSNVRTRKPQFKRSLG
jgi:hypothetical protein